MVAQPWWSQITGFMQRLAKMSEDSLHAKILSDNIHDALHGPSSHDWAAGIHSHYAGPGLGAPFAGGRLCRTSMDMVSSVLCWPERDLCGKAWPFLPVLRPQLVPSFARTCAGLQGPTRFLGGPIMSCPCESQSSGCSSTSRCARTLTS